MCCTAVLVKQARRREGSLNWIVCQKDIDAKSVRIKRAGGRAVVEAMRSEEPAEPAAGETPGRSVAAIVSKRKLVWWTRNG